MLCFLLVSCFRQSEGSTYITSSTTYVWVCWLAVLGSRKVSTENSGRDLNHFETFGFGSIGKGGECLLETAHPRSIRFGPLLKVFQHHLPLRPPANSTIRYIHENGRVEHLADVTTGCHSSGLVLSCKCVSCVTITRHIRNKQESQHLSAR